MDPTACWHLVLEGDKYAAQDLAEWLSRGGFPPQGKTREEVAHYLFHTFSIRVEES